MHAAVLRYSVVKQERATCLEFESRETRKFRPCHRPPCLYREEKRKNDEVTRGSDDFFGINKGVRDRLYLEAGPPIPPPIGLERERVSRDR